MTTATETTDLSGVWADLDEARDLIRLIGGKPLAGLHLPAGVRTATQEAIARRAEAAIERAIDRLIHHLED